MTQRYRLDWALLQQGWARDALVTVGDDGIVNRIDAGEASAAAAVPGSGQDPCPVRRVSGYVVPGMANAHSHAFQRGMIGSAEYRLSARDSFWTWRRAMYALANRIEPEDLEVLATQLYIEMLKSGYTCVAEFHYVHRRSGGEVYAQANELWQAVDAAAAASGIALTFLPTLYQTSDFGAQPLRPEQQRFALDTEQFLRAVEQRVGKERGARIVGRRTGAAFHSLRAVPLPALQEALAGLRAIDPAMPIHIHVAEQRKEVESCVLHTGRRPIELLLAQGVVDAHWCLVHATHASPQELRGIASSGASVCVSVSTEANLGDGFFEASRFMKLGGRVCIGSDSQATVDPVEELRWMEYQQRLRRKRRAVLADAETPHVGTRLWRDAARYGAQAVGQNAGVIAVGRRADWLVLDAGHPGMAGARAESALDHLLFAGAAAAIRDVMVAGRWVVESGRHPAEGPLRGRFLELMSRLGSAP